MKMKRALARMTALGLAFTLAACSTPSGGDTSNPSKSEGSGSSSEAAGSSEDSGGSESTGDKVLHVQVDVEVASMDAQVATDGTSFEVIAATIEGLYRLDEAGVAISAIATDQEVSEDGLTRTFTLRDDAKWSNGDPVTAHDFVYAWKRLVDPEEAAQYGFIVGIAGVANADAIMAGEAELDSLGVEATDDHTLVVSLDHPVSYFESLMTFPAFLPMNQAFHEAQGENFGTSAATLIANGPFKVTSYEPATTTIDLVKNPDYYAASEVSIDGLKFQVIKDSQQAMLSFQNGDLDVVALAGEQVDLFKDDPAFVTIEGGYLWYISMNTLVDGLENTALRTAIARSYNKETIANTVLKDGSTPADFFVPQGLATGPNGKDFREDGPTYLTYDPEAAAEALATAKSELGQDSFTFTMLVEDTESAINVSQVLKSQIESNLEGVTINITQLPKKNRLDQMRAGDYEVALTRWGPDYADPMTYLDLFITGGAYNDGSWSNSEYDSIVSDAKTGELALDPAARWDALYDAEAILLNDAALAPVYQSGMAQMINPSVSGIEYHSVGINRVYRNVSMK